MKKKNLFILSLITLTSFTGCKNNEENQSLTFTQNEYLLKTGEAIDIQEDIENVKYQIINNPFENIKIDENSGVFTFDDSIPNYTQVMAIATNEEIVTEPCVVTLYYDYQASDVHFTNMSSYIVNNEYITAVSSKNYSVSYSLKEKVSGITIDSETGKVSFSPLVNDGTTFKVIADSHGSTTEKEFIAMTEGFVEVITERQALEKNNTVVSAFYPLDFSKSSVEEEKIIAVVDSLNNPIASKYYQYDTKNKRLEIYPSILSTLFIGSNTFKIITERNSIQITLDVITKFINTVEDLVNINSSIEALSGYYILMNDLDLTNYLNSEGYNEGKGWTPIGQYLDTTDPTAATQYSFKGTFDGNGHVIRGLYANRKDALSFNAGLFGYTTSSATISNLGVEGSLTVSSYSGGLVGSNNGIIENCWANVDLEVISGEEGIYRYVGGLVGNNFGTIRNCYAIGKVNCDSYSGSLIGSNTGLVEKSYSYKKINTSTGELEDNCEKIIGYGSVEKDCIYFENENEMLNYNWANVLSEDSWIFTDNQLPSLKETLTEYNLRAIYLNFENKKYFKGDLIDFTIDIYPKSLESEFINYITYELSGEGYYLIGNSIYTSDAIDNQFTLTVSLDYKNIVISDQKNIMVNDCVENLEINHNLEYLEAGKRYLLTAEFGPDFATNDNISYYLSSRYIGATIQDNVLIIDDEFSYSSISFYAQSESGIKSNVVNLPVKKQNILPSGFEAIYENDNKNLEFNFDDNINLENVEVKVFNTVIDYVLEDNKIIVNRSILENSKDTKVRFIFKLNDGSIYGSDGYYFSHEKYTLDSLSNNNDIIKINSVDDFFKYFNTDPNENYSKEKLNNYNKTFVLTSNLDFGGKEIYGIGYGDAKFSGKFYGLGHTISNFSIKQNGNIENIKSSYYGVGLFAALSGEIYDLTLKDSKVDGKNFVGGLVGMLTDGYIENCHGINLKVTASEYQYSMEDIKVGKIVGKNYNGHVICSYHDNISLNTIG